MANYGKMGAHIKYGHLCQKIIHYISQYEYEIEKIGRLLTNEFAAIDAWLQRFL